MATMKDIANLVGVSLTTVSNVVHGNYDRVSPQTVQRILDAIEQLHYVPNMSARALVSHSSRIIAFVDTHSPQETYAGNGFAGVLLSGLEGVVTDHGYFLMMRRGTNEDVLRLMLNNWNPDGVIFKDRVPQSLVDFVKKQGKPCVTINTYLDDPELIQVRAEDRRGGYLAARHLIELGHRNILFIGAVNRGFKTVIAPAFGKTMLETDCVFCGQCINACPVGALRERDDTDKVWDALSDPEKFVVVQPAPAVRVALGEEFGLPIGTRVTGKMTQALRRLGFDKVFDTDFGADLTIMEEATELLGRIQNGGVLPMFTSCSPGWVKYLEHHFPEMIPNMSTCKSPMEMEGAIIKTYYAEKTGIDPANIVVVAVMPCTSKKFEAQRPEMVVNGMRAVDVSLTTRELARMIRDARIDFARLPDEECFDELVAQSTGAAPIFGVTGGVMEAALRTAADVLENRSVENVEYHEVRGLAGIKEATFTLGGKELKVAVANSTGAAKELIQRIKAGDASYAFVEVMACPGGCVNGGGQPIVSAYKRMDVDPRAARAAGLYAEDESKTIRKSHENPDIQKLYAEFLGEPNGHLAHKLLHTEYIDRSDG